MKLTVVIDAPEKEIHAAISSIPWSWLEDPEATPIRMVALAMRKAYLKAVHERSISERKPNA